MRPPMPENSKKMTNLRHPSPRAVVLAYDGLCTFEFGVAVEIFGLPRPEMGEDWYQFAVASVDDGELRAGSVFWPMAIWVCWKRRIWLSYPAGEGWTNPYPTRSVRRSVRRMPGVVSYSQSALAFSFWQPQACLTGGRQPPTGATRKL